MKIKKFGKTFTAKYWEGQQLGKRIAVDTETELIKGPGHIPRLVLSMAYDGSDTIWLIKNNNIKNFLEKHNTSIHAYHNAAFDLKVFTKFCNFDFHEMLMGQKIEDTAILYRLIYLATKGYEAKRYSLDLCLEEMYKFKLPKDNDIRLTFGQYLNDDGSVKYDDISKEHLEYAALDPVATWLVWEKEKEKFKDIPTSNQCAHYLHLLGDIALDKVSNTGIQVDLEYVNSLRDEWQAEMDTNAKIMASYGLVRKQKGFQAKYEEIIDFLEIDLPKTGKTKKTSMKGEHLEKYRLEQPFVKGLLDYLELEKLKNFLKTLTSERVFPRYSSIKKTSRTSCSGPNIQNPPRVGGVREAFVPKEGHVFIDIDYSSIELYALAQVLKNFYGKSVLFDKLNEGADVHIYAASKIFNVEESEVTKDQRQIAKICNYGLAANMGADTFKGHMAKSDVLISLERAKEIKAGWANAFPEIKKFWKRAGGREMFVSRTGFVRNNCSYTQYLNIHFQELVAAGCKIMLYMVQRSGYNVVAFIHDQILVEHPKESAEEVMCEIQRIMEDSMQKLIPDLKIATEGQILERFSK